MDDAFDTLGVIACAGEFPRLVIEGARRAGKRIVCIGCKGAVCRAEIEPLCDVYTEARAGELIAPRRFLQEQGVRHLMLTGQVKPAVIYTLRPDADARRLLRGLSRRNAHTLFTALCDYVAAGGITVLPSTTFMEGAMPGEGHLAGPPPTAEQRETARFGLGMAQQIAQLDIGQSIVVQGRRVVCVEAYKGTNECIDAAAAKGRAGMCLCKVTKRGHDMRFDVPCIGPTTVEHCCRAGIRHIAIEAGRTILFGRERVLRLCAQHGITLHALPVPPPEHPLPDPGHPADDRAHAALLAQAVEELGIGHAAIVCDGVALAVEDADGLPKCIRRAGRYMRRLRLARLASFLLRLLLGGGNDPLRPMVLVSSPQRPLSPADRRAARRAGIRCP